MGANVEADTRVPIARAHAMAARPLPPSYDPILLKTRIASYPDKFNYNLAAPSFLKPPNQSNIRSGIHGNTQLVTIFQFKPVHSSGIAAALQGGLVSGGDLNTELERLFPDLRPDGATFTAVEDLANSVLPDASAAFLERFFEGQFNSGQYHGIWTGLWRSFEPHLRTSPLTWLSAFGMQRPARRTLCLILRYRASMVRPLVRPTILDSGWYPEHFPSPAPAAWARGPASSAPRGGHPMNTGEPQLPLREEFIHRDCLRSHSWVAAWGWVDPSQNQSGTLPIPEARSRHYALLQASYDRSELLDWLSEP